MSASGPTPPPPSGIRPFEPSASARPEARAADILSLPPGLEEERGQVRHLRGEITRRDRDGEIRVRTDRGEVRLRVDPRAPTPQEGQRVDIDIPPGDPPAKAFVRPAPPKAVEGPPPLPPPVAPAVPPTQARTGPAEPGPPSAPGFVPGFVPLAPEDVPLRLTLLPPARFAVLALAGLPALETRLLPPEVEGSRVLEIALPPVPGADPARPIAFWNIEPVLSAEAREPVPSLDTLFRPFPPSSVLKPPGVTAAGAPPEPGTFNMVLPSKSLAQKSVSFPEGVLAFLASGGGAAVFAPPGADTLSPEGARGGVFDPSAQDIPLQLDIRLLQRADRSVAIESVRAESAQDTASLSGGASLAIREPSNALTILGRGFAGDLSGRVLSAADPQGRPLVALFFPDSAFAHVFALQAGGPDLTQGAGFTALALSPPDSAALRSDLPVPTWPAPVWPAMEELVQNLSGLSPAVAQSLVRVLPSPAQPNLVGPAILFFIAALKAGDMAGWVGEKAIDTLRRGGKSDALTRLGRDFGALSEGAARQTDDGQWKSLSIPFLWENRIHRAAFHHRSGGEDGAQGEGKAGGKSARFVFDLSFNRMGAVQLDGLYRDKRLDVALRTLAPLSQTMRQSLRARFADGVAQAGIAGEIHFQSDPSSFLKIPARDKPRSAWV